MLMCRLNAKVCPSGEKAGEVSPTDDGGGEVSLRFSPVSTNRRNSAKGPVIESLGAKIRAVRVRPSQGTATHHNHRQITDASAARTRDRQRRAGALCLCHSPKGKT
jgi:hypothetical protein